MGTQKNILTKVIVHRFDHKVSLIVRLDEDFQCKLMHKKRFIVRLRSKISTMWTMWIPHPLQKCSGKYSGTLEAVHLVHIQFFFTSTPSLGTQNYVIVAKYGYLKCARIWKPLPPLSVSAECGLYWRPLAWMQLLLRVITGLKYFIFFRAINHVSLAKTMFIESKPSRRCEIRTSWHFT